MIWRKLASFPSHVIKVYFFRTTLSKFSNFTLIPNELSLVKRLLNEIGCMGAVRRQVALLQLHFLHLSCLIKCNSTHTTRLVEGNVLHAGITTCYKNCHAEHIVYQMCVKLCWMLSDFFLTFTFFCQSKPTKQLHHQQSSRRFRCIASIQSNL